ncbi:hypothetical protein HELRODRAFT_182603 [Helobdella robusta]|uniref:Uncharacterized protein n=1 Tax=Helobdella robusta TaxID=6412 RepID=T1FIG4_HELRO|nr:hypothetical protein HELRODRAFT_182603 [Helobdella robusta]ESN90775.1 hypothetical protein HELRODRAFT_182603 [Helobdella robusta]
MVPARLDNSSIRVSLCLRLGLPVVSSYRCLCGADVSQLSHHGLSYRLGLGRQTRHSAINDYICRLFKKAYISAIKEPAGLLSESNERPDGYTRVPWSQGCCFVWDKTFCHTLHEKCINYMAMEPGSAAVKTADFKKAKYKDLNDNT